MSAPVPELRPKIARLWFPPDAAIRLTQLVTDPEYTLAQAVEVVSADAELSGRILRIVASESPSPNRTWTVAAVGDSLGKRPFANLAVACWCSDYFHGADEGYQLPPGGMWRQAVASGLASQMLALKANLASANAAFTAGLLHDIGKTVLAPHLAAERQALDEMVLASEEDFLSIERHIVRTDHTEAGAIVAKDWNFHPIFRSVIRNHHDPDRMPDDDALTTITHLADVLVCEIGFGGAIDSLRYHADQTAAARLRLTESDIDRVKLDLLQEDSRPGSLLRLSLRQLAAEDGKP